ncbi:hypothetical protein ERJ75_000906600 [Trypanosoma vivax]|nr:hypothetical protein ERJ75_000906600 [Trypanosoma vivax]
MLVAAPRARFVVSVIFSCCSLRVRSPAAFSFSRLACARKRARRHPQRQARAGVVAIDRRAAAGGTAWAQVSPTSHKGRRWDNSGDAVQCEGGRVQWTRKEMRLGILCVLAAVAAALAQRRGAEAGDPPGWAPARGTTRQRTRSAASAASWRQQRLAAEAVTARLAAGGTCSSEARSGFGGCARTDASTSGEDSEARGRGAPLIERLERALLTKARLNEAHSDAADATSALARAAQEVRTLLGVMGSLVDKSEGTTQSCPRKGQRTGRRLRGGPQRGDTPRKGVQQSVRQGNGKARGRKNGTKDITQALGALAQKEGDSHPENGTCIAHESSADAGDCASNGGGRSTKTQVKSLLGDASDASECPLLVKAAASKYGLAIKQQQDAAGTLHIGTFIMATARASAKSTLTLDTEKTLNAKEGWTLKEILAKLTKAADTLGVTGDNDTCKGSNAELCTENDKSIELAKEHVTSAHRVARRRRKVPRHTKRQRGRTAEAKKATRRHRTRQRQRGRRGTCPDPM